MAKLMRNMLVLAKIQPTSGTDSLPTAALNSILARGVAPTPVNAEFVDRDLIKPYFGHTGQVQSQAYSMLEFEVEIAGSGAAGTAPKFGPLLRSSGFSETISAGIKVDYATITSAQEAITLHCYLDGLKYAMTDCKGTVSFAFNAKGIPVMKYKYVGFASTPSDDPVPTGSDFTGFIAPLAVNKVNTPTFALHDIAVRATALEIDMANQVSYRNYIGSEAVRFTDRKPTGKTTYELDTVAVKDWYTAIKNGTLGTLQLIHGTTAGNILELNAPKVQLTNPSISNDDGLAMFSADLALQPNAGNDELLLSFK